MVKLQAQKKQSPKKQATHPRLVNEVLPVSQHL